MVYTVPPRTRERERANGMDSILARFDESARELRDRPALVDAGGDALSYSNLEDVILEVVRKLEAAAIGTGDRVVILAPDVPLCVASYLACCRLKAIAVPLTPHHTTRELRDVFAVVEPDAVLARDIHLDALEESPYALLESRKGVAIGPPAPDKHQPSTWLDASSAGSRVADETAAPVVRSRDDAEAHAEVGTDTEVHNPDLLGLWISRNGSGAPGAVPALESKMLACMDAVERLNEGLYEQGEEVLTLLPPDHSFGFLVGFLLPLCTGCTVHYADRFLHAAEIRAIIRDHGVGVMSACSTVYCALLRDPAAEREDFDSLRVALCGESLLQADLLDKLDDRLGIDVCQTYSMTETLVLTGNRRDSNRRGTLGQPLAGVEIRIVDDEGIEVPVGQPGEIVASGPAVMDSHPEHHARFHDAFFRTGDRGHVDEDGFLHFDGHIKRVAEVGGQVVDLVELRQVVLECPGALDVDFDIRHDELRGHGIDIRVTSKRKSDLDDETVREHCRRELSPHKNPRNISVERKLRKSDRLGT